jgi:V8-like Glu-specific endopeptidase
MAKTQEGPDTVVFARTEQPEAVIALGPTELRLKVERGGAATTGARRPRPRTRALAAVRGPLPRSYMAPAGKYLLREEPDKRFRILGTAPAGSVKALRRTQMRDASDNRVRITSTTVWPYSVHGHCIITYPDQKQYIGSGTMVNKHHVLTAGHVVYSKDNGGWATSVQFNAAQNDSTLPYGSAFATYLFSFKGWTESHLRDYDMGMLILDRDLGNSTGWLGLIATSDGNLSNHQITVAGYPGDKGGQQLWAATAPIVSVADNQVSYDAYTRGGDSGAGVYSIWDGISMEHVCADHVAGPNGIPNTGCRLAQDKFNRIVNEWLTK